MKIEITRSVGMAKVIVTVESTTIDLGWMLYDSVESGELANMLRSAADELEMGECVPYEDLIATHKREQEREGA